jgi:uncharacterized protein (TIGR03435 family)
MHRTFASPLLAGLIAGVAFGQPAASPAFEIADIHLSAQNISPALKAARSPKGDALRGGRYVALNASTVDLIGAAYGVENDKVLDGPSWLEIDQFDIIAKPSANATEAMVKPMLQNLLADRFKLVIHNDSRPFPVFVLSAGKGKQKLKEADPSAMSGCDWRVPGPVGPPMEVVCHNVTMASFAEQLPRMAANYVKGPVVDRTDLKGSWDFEFQFTNRPTPDATSLFDAIERLGLKLDQQKLPLPVIVVDSAQRPSPNSPDVTRILPPRPTEFEVAVIKPSGPGVPGQFIRLLPGGRWEVRGRHLKDLITMAWDIGTNTDELLAGAPKWLDTVRWDVTAQAPVTGPETRIDQEDIRTMLRALLADRFKLKTHYEDRPRSAYALVAAKPKLTQADPSNRSKCEVAQVTGRDVSVAPMRAITCQNVTMAQFVGQIPRLEVGYLGGKPVLDSTGIEGSFDFVINFGPAGADSGGARGTARQDPGAPADPSGAVSLFDALSKQLGLKLELQKRPLPVLVIDHIEEMPTEN